MEPVLFTIYTIKFIAGFWLIWNDQTTETKFYICNTQSLVIKKNGNCTIRNMHEMMLTRKGQTVKNDKINA